MNFSSARKVLLWYARYRSNVVALIAALVLTGPPGASISTAAGTAPLVMSSWCWNAHCGAPFTTAKKTATAARGATVSVGLGFTPRHVRVAIAGKQVSVVTRGRIVSWAAGRGGGVPVHVTGPHGWVTYVGRLKVA